MSSGVLEDGNNASAELLAAKAACCSPVASRLLAETFAQLMPPSLVSSSENLPSTGSPRIVPCSRSSNWTASQNPSLSGFVNSSFQLEQPSVVLYSRDWSPGPLDITIAVWLSHAQTPRKSSLSAPGGIAHDCHSYPPSSVRRTVPLVPLAQATPPPTAWIPRSPAPVPLCSSTHGPEVCPVVCPKSAPQKARRKDGNNAPERLTPAAYATRNESLGIRSCAIQREAPCL